MQGDTRMTMAKIRTSCFAIRIVDGVAFAMMMWILMNRT